MYKYLTAAVVCLSLGACTAAQQTTVTSFQAQITQACSVAMSLASVDPAIGVYITAGCGTEEAIAALALNPTSLAWVNGLIAQAKVKL